MKEILLAITLLIACLGFIYYLILVNCYRIFINDQLDVTAVVYSFVITKIRENKSSYDLISSDNIHVRISREDFEKHEVDVGKIWIFNGNEHYCVDPKQFLN